MTCLLPVRNGMPFLSAALRSLLEQSHRDLFVIAWDNGSTDGTLAELHGWIPSRLPGLIVSDRPLPLGRCLAEMVTLANTELCARIDADDVNRPDRLATQVRTMLGDPTLTVVGGQHDFIDEHGRLMQGAWSQPLDDATIRWRLRWRNSLNHPTVMFRRARVLAAGNYRECGPFEDHDLWLRLARHGAMLNLPDILIQYRRSSGSVTANSDFPQAFDAVARLNAGILFPGMSEDKALGLRQAARLESEAPARLRDVIALRRGAIALARDVGHDDMYFRRTDWYVAQRRALLRRSAPPALLAAHRLMRKHSHVRSLRAVPRVD